MTRIPISLVVGFLGSGKTSLLAHWLSGRSPDRNWVCVVNEFGSRDVDGERLAGAGTPIRPIPGGSVFCRCLVTEFMAVLSELTETHARRPIDGVLIEASGVADPASIERLLRETGQADRFSVVSVVAVVDPGSFAKLRHTLPNIASQVAAANRIVLNKVDRYADRLIGDTADELRRLNPRAEVLRCSYGRVASDPFVATVSIPTSNAELAPCRDPAFVSFPVNRAVSIDAAKLAQAIDRVREHLYRLKGHLRVGGVLRQLDLSATGLVLDADCSSAQPPGVVAIYDPARADEVRRHLLRPLDTGELDE